MKRLVISGAGGFLGKNIIKRALAQRIDVVAISSRKADRADIAIIDTVDFLNNGYQLNENDIFINCLFPTNADGYKMANGLEKAYRTIIMARKSKVGAFINISSQSVYASKRTAPAKETDALSLETPYAVGKYSTEVFVDQVFGDIPHTNVRMASLLGVGYEQRIVNRMVNQALMGENLRVVGGMQRYGFLDVRDAAAGLVKLAMSNPERWQGTYNLGRLESYSLIDVVECIIKEIRKQTDQIVSYDLVEGEDIRNSAINPARFMQDFSWNPEYTLSKTTADIICEKAGRDTE